MTKLDLAKWLARKSHRSKAEAADVIDRLIHRIVKEGRQSGKVPGSHQGKAPSKSRASAPKAKP